MGIAQDRNRRHYVGNVTLTTVHAMTSAHSAVIDDPVRRVVAEKLAEKRISWNEASRRLDRNTTYIYRFLTAGSPRVLGDTERARLSSMLGIPEEQLTSNDAVTTTRRASRSPQFQPAGQAIYSGPTMAGQLKVLGAVTVGGHFPSAGGFTVPMPLDLAGIPGAFAVQVPDRRLEPAARLGSMLFVHPGLVAGLGDLAVVKLAGTDQLVIGILDNMNEGGTVFLGSTNPEANLKLPYDRVASIGKVVLTRHP